MVGVHVGQQHRIDLLGTVARGPEVVDEMAHGRAETARRAGIHQDQVVPAMHQVAIDRGLHAVIAGLESPREQGLDFLRIEPLQQLRRELDVAVIKGGDRVCADGLVEESGHLDGGGRRHALGTGSGSRQSERGERQQAADGSETEMSAHRGISNGTRGNGPPARPAS